MSIEQQPQRLKKISIDFFDFLGNIWLVFAFVAVVIVAVSECNILSRFRSFVCGIKRMIMMITVAETIDSLVLLINFPIIMALYGGETNAYKIIMSTLIRLTILPNINIVPVRPAD